MDMNFPKWLLLAIGAFFMCLIPGMLLADVDHRIPMIRYNPDENGNGITICIEDFSAGTCLPVKTNANQSWVPSLSPDRAKLVYTEAISEGEPSAVKVYTVDSQSSFTIPGVSTRWAAYFDGNGKILFCDYSTGVLKTMDPDGSNIATFASPAGSYSFDAFYLSPDREKIIAIEYRETTSDYYTGHYERLVLLSSTGSRVAATPEYLGEWNNLSWKADSSSFLYFSHLFNVAGGVYQGKTPKYAVYDPVGDLTSVTDLSSSYMGVKESNICLFTQSSQLLSLMYRELYDTKTGSFMGDMSLRMPIAPQTMFGWNGRGEIFLADPDGSNFRIFVESPVGDSDGDGKSDLTVWRESSGTWYTRSSYSPGSYTSKQWGIEGDKPVAGDYDGDGKSDTAVWRPSNGVWYTVPSGAPGTYTVRQWGLNTDIPVPGDYDGDGKTDVAVWRSSTGIWYVMPSGAPGTYTARQWGMNTDIPVQGDYDGDGITDIGVWRKSTGMWYGLFSSTPGTYATKEWGMNGDIPVPADYDKDGKWDVAVWRPSDGTWYITNSMSQDSYTSTQWGTSTDTPVAADFDGDGSIDIAVWRPGNGVWYILPSNASGTYTATQWGMDSDVPVSTLTGIMRSIQ
jgi:hypothetical protein